MGWAGGWLGRAPGRLRTRGAVTSPTCGRRRFVHAWTKDHVFDFIIFPVALTQNQPLSRYPDTSEAGPAACVAWPNAGRLRALWRSASAGDDQSGLLQVGAAHVHAVEVHEGSRGTRWCRSRRRPDVEPPRRASRSVLMLMMFIVRSSVQPSRSGACHGMFAGRSRSRDAPDVDHPRQKGHEKRGVGRPEGEMASELPNSAARPGDRGGPPQHASLPGIDEPRRRRVELDMVKAGVAGRRRSRLPRARPAPPRRQPDGTAPRSLHRTPAGRVPCNAGPSASAAVWPPQDLAQDRDPLRPLSAELPRRHRARFYRHRLDLNEFPTWSGSIAKTSVTSHSHESQRALASGGAVGGPGSQDWRSVDWRGRSPPSPRRRRCSRTTPHPHGRRPRAFSTARRLRAITGCWPKRQRRRAGRDRVRRAGARRSRSRRSR